MIATETLAATDPLEAVIISGPRRGEIIRVPDTISTELSPKEIQLLNDALDNLDAALQRLSAEIRETTRAFQAPSKAA